jgi:hypothetical protein
VTIFNVASRLFVLYLLLLFRTVGARGSFSRFFDDVFDSVFSRVILVLQLVHFEKEFVLLHLIEQQVSAAATRGSKYLPYKLCKSNMDYGGGKFDVAEVARAFARTLCAGLASKARVYDT